MHLRRRPCARSDARRRKTWLQEEVAEDQAREAAQAAAASRGRRFLPGDQALQSGLPARVARARDLLRRERQPEGQAGRVPARRPGGGTDPKMRRFFNPKRYRIVLFDQRGCGRAGRAPASSTTPPGTWSRTSRRSATHLGIERWQVFGGSWGSTLALAYAQKHPERCTEIVLRGIFLLRRLGARVVLPEPRGRGVACSRTCGSTTSRRCPPRNARTACAPTTSASRATTEVTLLTRRAPGRSGKARCRT